MTVHTYIHRVSIAHSACIVAYNPLYILCKVEGVSVRARCEAAGGEC